MLAVLPQFYCDVKYVAGVEQGVDACFVERIKLVRSLLSRFCLY